MEMRRSGILRQFSRQHIAMAGNITPDTALKPAILDGLEDIARVFTHDVQHH